MGQAQHGRVTMTAAVQHAIHDDRRYLPMPTSYIETNKPNRLADAAIQFLSVTVLSETSSRSPCKTMQRFWISS